MDNKLRRINRHKRTVATLVNLTRGATGPIRQLFNALDNVPLQVTAQLLTAAIVHFEPIDLFRLFYQLNDMTLGTCQFNTAQLTC